MLRRILGCAGEGKKIERPLATCGPLQRASLNRSNKCSLKRPETLAIMTVGENKNFEVGPGCVEKVVLLRN